ncbi:serine/threonine-protein phosphatase Pgam5, mitochondrial isoform X2 [Sitodiplosis mosellana]|uniref:serine/threonine-protein phosphatase Pgam5, mitochondrial isoform X2 n=1 Tax=Sitodiplosis mosellana TaxID=263140 RepID=UPI002444189F|nr:serine/threonine-protein phosphatase Pgam5, mitochondrial isoform X2 [Sitodiplosis mosellana]
MSYWSKLRNFTAIAVGCGTGIGVYLYLNRNREALVYTSWTTNTVVPPEAKWDFNWDHRDPASLVKPLKSKATPEDENKYNERLEAVKPTAVRHLILIRHGQYNLDGVTDADRFLTEIGRKQAAYTGDRLKLLQIPFDKMVRSTMTRAQETGKIISTQVANIPIENCSLIEEGAPIAPQPPIGHWHPEPHFFQDGARIEAGFRKYFHRASAKQQNDSYTLIVCHANVIRYFVCRALQIPAEAWLRISLNHASITWISIQPSGRVTLRLLGDSGHIPPEHVTSR